MINPAVLHSSISVGDAPLLEVDFDLAGAGAKSSRSSSRSSSARIRDSDSAAAVDTLDVVGTDVGALVMSPSDCGLQVADLQHQEQHLLLTDKGLDGSWWTWLVPRLLLAGVACIYGSNCPIGSVMDHSISYPSAGASARFVIAAIALAPFIPRLKPALIGPALVAGTFTGTGYVAQSLALSEPFNIPPATVSFLGALTVIWCPVLEWIVDGEDTSWNARPQVWVAGVMCLIGVGVLELMGGPAGLGTAVDVGTNSLNDLSSSSSPMEWMGNGLAILQAIGFGTGLFLSERMMKRQPDQALPVTAVMIAVTALCSLLWVLSDGWIGNSPDNQSMFLPNILMDGFADPDGGEQRMLALAVLWTGLISTSLNFGLEVFAMSKVPCGEASIILATEPLWACLFASLLLGESLGWNDAFGGLFIVSACLVTAISTETLHKIFPFPTTKERQETSIVTDL